VFAGHNAAVDEGSEIDDFHSTSILWNVFITFFTESSVSWIIKQNAFPSAEKDHL